MIQYTEWWGWGGWDGNVTAATNKTHNPALTGKKEEYAKPRTEGREVSYRKIGLTTVAVTQDLLSGMPLVLKIELICLWNSILPEPGQPIAQLSKLRCLTACKETRHAVCRWYRTVHIPWLVASYDTHKANVDWILIPQTTGVKFDHCSKFVLTCTMHAQSSPKNSAW